MLAVAEKSKGEILSLAVKDIMDNAAIRLRSKILLAVKVELGQKEQDKDHNRVGKEFLLFR